MPETPIRRLAADAVGFTARVADNESGALRAIKASLEALEQVIGLHRGRVVKTMGDGLLMEFGSVVAAVSAAATMQLRLSERRRDLPEDAHFDFRMGIHVGDIVVDGEDILGDGVNIASRLESEAPAGRVFVSERVHDDVAGKLDIGFEDFGKRSLAGIARPVRVFALTGAEPRISPPRPQLPDKPSVAVLPFVNLSSDPEQDYFADGLTEDIITSLVSVPWLFIIARNSSFIYKGAAVDIRKVGQDLGVRYVLEGSVRRSGRRLRVTGQLVDAETGTQLWADRMNGDLDDVFDLQDKITDEVVSAIAPEIRSAEQGRVARKRPENLTAYDWVLQAMAAINRAQIAESIDHLDKAIDLSPDYAKALAMRAWVHTLQVGWLAEGSFAKHDQEAMVLSQRAFEAASDDVEVAALSAYSMGFFGNEVDRSLRLLSNAVQRCPSYMWAWASLGMQHAHHHDPEEGIDACDQAIRLSPRDPMAFRAHLGKSAGLFYARRWQDVVPAARTALEINPNMVVSWVYLVSALADTGDSSVLGSARQELFSRFPETTVSRFRQYFGHFANYRKHREVIEARMGAAGIPD